MPKRLTKKYWIYGLLLIPAIFAVLALQTQHFIYKAGVAGCGILILVLLHFRRKNTSKDWWMIPFAFLFSIGGDWFLSNRNGEIEMFIGGILLFFLAHIGYLAYALFNGRLNRPFTLVLLIVYLVFFFLKLFPTMNNQVLMAAALIYLIISCFSLGAAVGIKSEPATKWLYVFGIFLVLFSDTLIAFREFAHFEALNFLILPTYYLAQISVTSSGMKSLIRNTTVKS